MYRIYSAQITRFGKPAVVITTSFQKSGDVYGESFCIFLDKDVQIDSKIIKFGRGPSEGGVRSHGGVHAGGSIRTGESLS